MPRRKRPRSVPTERTTILLPAEDMAWLRAFAAATGEPVSYLVELAIGLLREAK